MVFNAADLVHEHDGRYVIAVYRDGRYEASQRKDIARLTGCSGIYGPLSYVAGNAYSYKRRADALRKARELYAPDCQEG